MQLLKSKDSPRTEIIKKNIRAIDPKNRYSNQADRANYDIYDDFKLKRSFGHGFRKKYFSVLRFKG